MPTQKSIKSDLHDNPDLTSELRFLVAKLVEEKRFEYLRGNIDSYPGLMAIGVLEADESNIRVCPNDFLAYGFMMVYQGELLTNSVDLNVVIDFERSILERLRTNPMTSELFRVTQQISRLWVKSRNIDEGDDLTSFSATPESAQRFVRIFCDVLPELNLKTLAIYTHIRQFVQAQINIPDLTQVLETYFEHHPGLASELYSYIQEHPFDEDIHFRMTTQSALNRLDWESYLPQLQALTQRQEDQILALSVMFRACIETDQQANEYLNLALSCDQSRDEVCRHLPNVVLQVMRFPRVLSTDTVSRCFDLLSDLAQSESTTVQGAVSRAIWLITGYEVERFAVLMTLLQNAKLDPSLRTGNTNTVDTLLATTFRGSERWFTVFDYLVDQTVLIFKTEDFTQSLENLVLQFGEGLMSQLLPRLIDRRGDIRQSANQILDFINHRAPHLRFSSDELLRLSSLQQYRLWLIVDQSYRQPSTTIPLLLSLFESDDELLIEKIIHHLEIASENHMGQVLETLDSICQPENHKHQRVQQKVNAHFKAFLDYRRRKYAVNELNPFLTQSTLFRQFDDLRRMSWDQQRHQRLRTDSLMSMFQEVILSKGGGWRNSKTGVTSQLNNILTTINLPRFYFLHPVEMDFEFAVSLYKEDWNDDTDLTTWITHE